MTPETPDDIAERLRWESRLSRNGGVLFLPVLLDKAADEIDSLRAQVAQLRDPQTIVTLALAYAATRAHDEGRTIGEMRKAACILFGAGMVDAAIDKARKA